MKQCKRKGQIIPVPSAPKITNIKKGFIEKRVRGEWLDGAILPADRTYYIDKTYQNLNLKLKKKVQEQDLVISGPLQTWESYDPLTNGYIFALVYRYHENL